MEYQYSLTPYFPLYSHVRAFLRVVRGESKSVIRKMNQSIAKQMGTRQNPVDWSNPDEWIPTRLLGAERKLALTIWNEGRLNPYYLGGVDQLIKRHHLWDDREQVFLTPEGDAFLAGDDEPFVVEIDEKEMIFLILELVASHPGQMGSLRTRFTEICRMMTAYQTENSIYDVLKYRLDNLINRGLVQSKSRQYSITDVGLLYKENYLKTYYADALEPHQPDLQNMAHKVSKEARHQLRTYLSQMNPHAFEHLIKRLLDAMDYSNVIVTSASHDGGVDVLADASFGINTLKTAIQVKRYKGNVDRPTLDQLRGSLHRFKAVQGAIITLGGFALGAKNAAIEDSAAPIMLIDGEKLLDLLIEYEIGIQKAKIEYYNFDANSLETSHDINNGEAE
jgi:restriction system protein